MSMPATALDPNATVVPIPPNLLPLFQDAAQRYGIPINILALVAKGESGFDPGQIGDQGTSYGLFQIHLSVHPGVTAAQAADAAFNINWAAQSLGAAYQRYNGNVIATILYNNCPVCADHFAATGTYGPTQALSQASQRYLGLILQPVGGVVGVGTTGVEWTAPSTGSSPTNPAMPAQTTSATTSSDPVVAGFQAMLSGAPLTGTSSTDIVSGGGLANAIGVDSTGGGQTDAGSTSTSSSTTTDAGAPAPTDTTTITTPHPVQIVPTGGNKAE